jgi:hypothetical protein
MGVEEHLDTADLKHLGENVSMANHEKALARFRDFPQPSDNSDCYLKPMKELLDNEVCPAPDLRSADRRTPGLARPAAARLPPHAHVWAPAPLCTGAAPVVLAWCLAWCLTDMVCLGCRVISWAM